MSALRCIRVASCASRIGSRLPARTCLVRSFNSSRSLREEDAAPVKAEITSPKVQDIYDNLLTLNMVETIELVNVLKEKFGYVEMAMSAAPAAALGDAPAEVEEVKVEKTEFNVRLDKFDSSSKIKVIKEVRTLTGLGLKQAKDLVESAPDAILKKDCGKEEAEAIMAKLKEVGGEVVLE